MDSKLVKLEWIVDRCQHYFRVVCLVEKIISTERNPCDVTSLEAMKFESSKLSCEGFVMTKKKEI